MVTIRDSSKTVRTVIDASTEPKDSIKKVRPMYDVHEPIKLSDQPEAIGEILGRQLASLRALSRDGARLDNEELEQLSTIARTLGTVVTALKKLAEPASSDELTEKQLRELAGG